MSIDGALVQPIGEWLMTTTQFIEGDRLDEHSTNDTELLGRTLADLHRALSRLDDVDIPPVAALGSTGRANDRSGWQLLHADFSHQNVIKTPIGVRIFDFDDCGYGAVEYDLANSLYMVLFDSEVAERRERYEAFRPAFLAGYADGSEQRVADAVIDDMIAIRIEALGNWLEDLSSAPIGIRTSSAAWLETLAAFVRSQRPATSR